MSEYGTLMLNSPYRDKPPALVNFDPATVNVKHNLKFNGTKNTFRDYEKAGFFLCEDQKI